MRQCLAVSLLLVGAAALAQGVHQGHGDYGEMSLLQTHTEIKQCFGTAPADMRNPVCCYASSGCVGAPFKGSGEWTGSFFCSVLIGQFSGKGDCVIEELSDEATSVSGSGHSNGYPAPFSKQIKAAFSESPFNDPGFQAKRDEQLDMKMRMEERPADMTFAPSKPCGEKEQSMDNMIRRFDSMNSATIHRIAEYLESTGEPIIFADVKASDLPKPATPDVPTYYTYLIMEDGDGKGHIVYGRVFQNTGEFVANHDSLAAWFVPCKPYASGELRITMRPDGSFKYDVNGSSGSINLLMMFGLPGGVDMWNPILLQGVRAAMSAIEGRDDFKYHADGKISFFNDGRLKECFEDFRYEKWVDAALKAHESMASDVTKEFSMVKWIINARSGVDTSIIVGKAFNHHMAGLSPSTTVGDIMGHANWERGDRGVTHVSLGGIVYGTHDADKKLSEMPGFDHEDYFNFGLGKIQSYDDEDGNYFSGISEREKNENRLVTNQNTGAGYQIVQFLGAGAEGYVYKAKVVNPGDTGLSEGSVVAVKLAATSPLVTGLVTSTMRNSYQAMSAIDSPHIMKMYDFFTEVLEAPSSMELFIKGEDGMDWMYGKNYYENGFVRRGHKATKEQYKSIMRGAISGLKAIVDAGYEVRDIKVENTMIEGPNSPEPRFIFIDLSLVKLPPEKFYRDWALQGVMQSFIGSIVIKFAELDPFKYPRELRKVTSVDEAWNLLKESVCNKWKGCVFKLKSHDGKVLAEATHTLMFEQDFNKAMRLIDTLSQ